jgi:hypothetical protein
MTHPNHRLQPLAAAVVAAVTALAVCQDRKPAEAQMPPASSGEYPIPSNTASPSTSAPDAAVSGDGKVEGSK